MKGIRLLGLLLALLAGGCLPAPPTASLSPTRARPGEAVTLVLQGASAEGAAVWVAGVEAPVLEAGGNRLRFLVPSVSGGPQEVRVRTSRGEIRAVLGVLGQVDPRRILLRLPLGQTPTLPLGFTLERQSDLPACGFSLAELGYGGEALGQALEDLEAQDPSYKADPESLWSLGGWVGEAVGARPR
ncbi:hypothetical protein [Thermus scotoductus]|uniref:hypothetical protein n=1 Tax=Thermus scotoductus TaxID=37636 RepID=UPI001C12C8A0